MKNKPPTKTIIVLNINELKYTSGNLRAKSLFRILAIILMTSREAIDIIISPRPIKIRHIFLFYSSSKYPPIYIIHLNLNDSLIYFLLIFF